MSPPPAPPSPSPSSKTNSSKTNYQKHSISLTSSSPNKKKSKSKSNQLNQSTPTSKQSQTSTPTPPQSQPRNSNPTYSTQVPSSPTKKIKLSHPTTINTNSNSTTPIHQPQQTTKMTTKKKPKPKSNQKSKPPSKKKSTNSRSLLSTSISLFLKISLCYLLFAYFYFCPKDPTQNPLVCSNLAELHWALEPHLSPYFRSLNRNINQPLRAKVLPVWNQNVLPVWNQNVLPVWNHHVFPTLTKVYNQIEKLEIHQKTKPLITHFQTRYETKLLPHLQRISHTTNRTIKVLKQSKFINQTKTKLLVLKSQIKFHVVDRVQNTLIPLTKKTYKNEINPFFIKYCRPKLIQLKNIVLEHHLWSKAKETVMVWYEQHFMERSDHFMDVYVRPQVRKIMKKLNEYRDRKQVKVEVDDFEEDVKVQDRSKDDEVKGSVGEEDVETFEESERGKPDVVLEEEEVIEEPVVPVKERATEKPAAAVDEEQISEEPIKINEEKRVTEEPVVIEPDQIVEEPAEIIEEQQPEVFEEPEAAIEEQSTIFEAAVNDVLSMVTEEEPVVDEESPREVKQSPVPVKETPVAVDEPVKVDELPVAAKEQPVAAKQPPVTAEEPLVTAEEAPRATEEEPPRVIEQQPTTKGKEELVSEKEGVHMDTERTISDEQSVKKDPLESNEGSSPALEVKEKIETESNNEDVLADDIDDFLELIKDEEEIEKRKGSEEPVQPTKRRTPEQTASDRAELERYRAESYEKMKEMEEEQILRLITLINQKRDSKNLKDLEDMISEEKVSRVREEREKLEKKIKRWFEKNEKVELKSMESKQEEIELIIKKSKEKFRMKVIEIELKRLHEFEVEQRKIEFEVLEQTWSELDNFVVEVQAKLGPGLTWLDDVTYKDWESYHLFATMANECKERFSQLLLMGSDSKSQLKLEFSEFYERIKQYGEKVLDEGKVFGMKLDRLGADYVGRLYKEKSMDGKDEL